LSQIDRASADPGIETQVHNEPAAHAARFQVENRSKSFAVSGGSW
jgi:hypothetical protein